MNIKRFISKKAVIGALVAAVAIGGGGAAFAYFTAIGSGSGSAQTTKAVDLEIQQVGAGYDSLIAGGSYTQDQCFSCDGPSELGNEVTLAGGNAEQLVSVVVAFDNWGAAISNGPLTVTIPNTVGGSPVSSSVNANFAAAINSQTPSVTNVTFDFSSQGAFVQPSFVYGITYGDEFGVSPGDPSGEASLNVALSSSATDLSVGSDTDPGSIWLADTYGNNNDFPVNSTIPTNGVFQQVVVNGGPYNPDNPGAYGDEAVTDDIPAVEINVVGGTAPALSPGGPSQPVDFAITNPGTSKEFVMDVTTTVGTPSSGTNVGGATQSCQAIWYGLSDPDSLGKGVVAVNKDLAPGTTLIVPSGLTISMSDSGNQDNCESPYGVVPLSFSSN